MTEEMSTLVKRRAVIKGQLTRIYNYISALPLELSDFSDCQVRQQKVNDLWSEFDIVQTRIEEADQGDAQLQERNTFEAGYYHTLAEISKRINPKREALTQRNVRSPSGLATEGITHMERVRLPTLDLPKFDGNYSHWLLFRDTFQALIDSNNELEDVQKFHYLKSCLIGDAAQILYSLEMSVDNYKTAWDLLKSRFENKRLLIHHHIQALLDLSFVVKESAPQLRKLLDDAQKHLRALKSLGEPTDRWDSLIIHMLALRLDNATRRKWELSLQSDDVPTQKEFTDFLSKHCAVLETLQPTKSASRSLPNPMSKRETLASHVNQTFLKSCVTCQGNHALYNCVKFKTLSKTERLDIVKRNRLCFNCLRADHTVDKCMAGGCKQCGRKHNTFLHNDERESKAIRNSTNSGKTEDQKCIQTVNPTVDTDNLNVQTNYSIISAKSKRHSQVLLATASIMIRDKCGKLHRCRAFLDAGSQTNIMSKDLHDRLQLSKQSSVVTLSGVGCNIINATGCVQATIHSTVSEFKAKLLFVIMDKIADRMPSMRVDVGALGIPKNIDLADPSYETPSSIDILLGGSIFWELLCIGQIRLGRHLPVLQKTKLGWIIGGNAPIYHSQEKSKKSAFCAILQEPDLSKQLEHFWNLEELQPGPRMSEEEKRCEREFKDTYQRDASGRFKVKFSFREDPNLLGDSFETALKRLNSLCRKLERDPNLKMQYRTCMNEYLELGHMTRIEENNEQVKTLCHYLPHHAVVKEDNLTTKLRIVFDGSCKTSSGKSLNDILSIGPNNQQELFDIIIRFRQYQYVLTGDVEKMYRQIHVLEEHRGFQRVLWKPDLDKPAEEFVLNTVTFGLALSSFLAVRCLHQLAYDHQESHQRMSEIILEDFYMDDLITGADSVEEIRSIKDEISRILLTGGFPMRKWKSNVSNLFEKEPNTNDLQSWGETVKTLGLYWNPETDSLSYKVKTPEVNRVSKRGILSFIAQIYDPLGLIGPICVQAKIIMQHLWQDKID